MLPAFVSRWCDRAKSLIGRGDPESDSDASSSRSSEVSDSPESPDSDVPALPTGPDDLVRFYEELFTYFSGVRAELDQTFDQFLALVLSSMASRNTASVRASLRAALREEPSEAAPVSSEESAADLAQRVFAQARGEIYSSFETDHTALQRYLIHFLSIARSLAVIPDHTVSLDNQSVVRADQYLLDQAPRYLKRVQDFRARYLGYVERAFRGSG